MPSRLVFIGVWLGVDDRGSDRWPTKLRPVYDRLSIPRYPHHPGFRTFLAEQKGFVIAEIMGRLAQTHPLRSQRIGWQWPGWMGKRPLPRLTGRGGSSRRLGVSKCDHVICPVIYISVFKTTKLPFVRKFA